MHDLEFEADRVAEAEFRAQFTGLSLSDTAFFLGAKPKRRSKSSSVEFVGLLDRSRVPLVPHDRDFTWYHHQMIAP